MSLNEFMGEEALHINKGNHGHLNQIPAMRNIPAYSLKYFEIDNMHEMYLVASLRESVSE